MFEKIWKIYGVDGHRQSASFGRSSINGKTWGGIHLDVLNSDITGTNEYTILVVRAETENLCRAELYAQISDGIFENCRVGRIEEIN